MSNLKNTKLTKAKSAKKDEFYTQYADIEKEMNAYLDYDPDVFKGKVVLLPCDDPEWSNFTLYFAQNFSRLGLKKLISTSYAHSSKRLTQPYQPSLFEENSPQFDNNKSEKFGKFFELNCDISKDGVVDIRDIKWKYLKCDGDFRSDEVRALRDKADIIVTNPPFSLFREFISWIIEGNKKFAVVGNKNCITYKEVFPLIKENKLWSGRTEWSGGMWFETKYSDDVDKVIDGVNMKNVPSIWVTNIEHGRRHEPLQLMTMEDNKRFNTRIIGKNAYLQYDNYKAIEVPSTSAIPSDFDGVMGVPISFLDKYNPDQFVILGIDSDVKNGILSSLISEGWEGKLDRAYLKGKRMYSRLLIRFKKGN
ncbi:adenine-specific methyltransferase EcoRI family protein [Neisseria perflava]|uniref:adenine-specific methyltransferase EcoRI family protein n=1 Tax=Neisseria perflava TaxID=33053 RepID=UPI00201A8CD1|nr:adenine-specific methyltransferase EcoRI family protein [Neisseria perflava]MCL5079533.1 adenine-specific methyltransferase EcoRI family protein [Neisseria perflava]